MKDLVQQKMGAFGGAPIFLIIEVLCILLCGSGD